MDNPRYAFPCGNLTILGSGSIASAVLPLIVRHFQPDLQKVTVISADDKKLDPGGDIRFERARITLTPENYTTVLAQYVQPGEFLLNLTAGISSEDLIQFCLSRNIYYLDTSNECWADTDQDAQMYTYQRRRRILDMFSKTESAAAALSCHGANPGLVSHFTKKAIEGAAKSWTAAPDVGEDIDAGSWASACYKLGIRTIHISERDTQYASIRRPENELHNTWSVEGLLEESFEESCLPWCPETEPPANYRDLNGDKLRVISLPGYACTHFLESWLPSCGEFSGMCIPHPEAFSIAEYLMVPQGNGGVHPTVSFVYEPCDAALASLNSARYLQDRAVSKVLIDEIVGGEDELGVAVFQSKNNQVYWYGSNLCSRHARSLVDDCNATSLQVAAGVLSGMVALLCSNRTGLMEPEELDSNLVLDVAKPYLGQVSGIAGERPGVS